MSCVYVNGELLDEDRAKISVFDHGLIVGDGIFETILLHRGRPFAISRHLERLERSARGLGLNQVNTDTVRTAIDEVVKGLDYETGRIRVTMTAGLGPLGSGRFEGPSTLVVAVSPEEATGSETSRVTVVPWTRNENGALAGLKTTSYAENALALHFAHEQGDDEAIFGNTRGELCEGTGSNIFVVLDDELLTPPLSSGCLAGTTRGIILDRADCREMNIALGHFCSDRVSEAFLASSIRCVQPISAIDGQEIGAPGPMTKVVMDLFNAILDSETDP